LDGVSQPFLRMVGLMESKSGIWDLFILRNQFYLAYKISVFMGVPGVSISQVFSSSANTRRLHSIIRKHLESSKNPKKLIRNSFISLQCSIRFKLFLLRTCFENILMDSSLFGWKLYVLLLLLKFYSNWGFFGNFADSSWDFWSVTFQGSCV
jgi:hypothetical protein